ncbi:putative quinol monooxygenase [Sediminitomix flava]|uniref:Quinol monooxygenase YgiN n=1 Tax=Sediminitomix flava TaxID=379075 RepID=A0A315ZGS9_SEDFL|nr:putative quinol monooxygenase [Sediminitomix flava]PWJ44373.1 quinol monooxygenase YgiN [Sediminitomix flava]
MNTPLYVFAKFHCQADKVKEMKALLQEFITETLANEEGCITYTYLQSTEDETLFTSLEIWQNSEVEAAHWEMEHMKRLLAKLPEVADGDAEITKYTRA